MQQYRKKPVVIHAILYTGENFGEVYKAVEAMGIGSDRTFVDHGNHMLIETLTFVDHGNHMLIETLEGKMRAVKGDWIIRGVDGEFYPCKPHIFEMTYDEVYHVTDA